MHVVLINPYMPIEDSLTILHPPLGLAYISTWVKKFGHTVEFLDLPIIEPKTRKSVIEKAVLQNSKVLVGITCVTITYSIAIEIANFIKAIDATIPICVGGPHVTFTAIETLERFPCFDFVFRYDTEQEFAKLVNIMEEGTSDYSLVNNLTYRKGEQIVSNPDMPPILNLDDLGFPDRTIFNIDRYLSNDYETVIMTARGCPNKCAFCSTSAMGRRYRSNTVAHIISEIEEVLGLGFKSVFFGDDTFPADRNKIISLCDEIISRNIKFEWTCNMRVLDVERNLIRKMKAAGMYRTFIGYESFDNDTLKSFKKGSNLDMQIRAAEILREEGVELHSSMIIGCASDTREMVLRNVDFLKEQIRPTLATFNTIELRPGTLAYQNPEQFGYIMEDKYWYEKSGCIDSIHVRTVNLTANDIRTLCFECYKRFYT